MATAMKIRPTQNYPLKSFQADVMQFVQTEVFLCLNWFLASTFFSWGGGQFCGPRHYSKLHQIIQAQS